MMISLDPTHLVDVITRQHSVPYSSELCRISRDYADSVRKSAESKFGAASPFTREGWQPDVAVKAEEALGIFLSLFFRRDAKYDRSDLAEGYNLYDKWISLRQSHGETEPHPSQFAYEGTLLGLQWRFAEAAPLFERAAELNLMRPNKYPALTSLFNAADCWNHCGEFAKSKVVLQKLEDVIGIIQREPDWEAQYRARSLSSFKSFDLRLWACLGWCDHYIHLPTWESDPTIVAAFEGKWDQLTTGRMGKSKMTLDVAAVIFSDIHWVRNRNDIAEAVWKSIYLDSAHNWVVRLGRTVNLLLDRKHIDFSGLRVGVAALIVAASLIYPSLAERPPSGIESQDAAAPVVLMLNDLQTTELFSPGIGIVKEAEYIVDQRTQEIHKVIVESTATKVDVGEITEKLAIVGAADQDVS
jgi:tetratricopeptide (TPR) repeat protein